MTDIKGSVKVKLRDHGGAGLKYGMTVPTVLLFQRVEVRHFHPVTLFHYRQQLPRKYDTPSCRQQLCMTCSKEHKFCCLSEPNIDILHSWVANTVVCMRPYAKGWHL